MKRFLVNILLRRFCWKFRWNRQCHQSHLLIVSSCGLIHWSRLIVYSSNRSYSYVLRKGRLHIGIFFAHRKVKSDLLQSFNIKWVIKLLWQSKIFGSVMAKLNFFSLLRACWYHLSTLECSKRRSWGVCDSVDLRFISVFIIKLIYLSSFQVAMAAMQAIKAVKMAKNSNSPSLWCFSRVYVD